MPLGKERAYSLQILIVVTHHGILPAISSRFSQGHHMQVGGNPTSEGKVI
jgi:hypothetical protein